MEKVYLKKIENQLEYATSDSLSDLLLLLNAKYSAPIFWSLKLLSSGEIDTISFEKNKPLFRFHVTKIRDTAWFSIKEDEIETTFKIRLDQLKIFMNKNLEISSR